MIPLTRNEIRRLFTGVPPVAARTLNRSWTESGPGAPGGQYQENLGFHVDDERRRFLFNIHGDAGVGKTYLTKQLRQTAIDNGGLTAYIDETVDDATSAMAVIAEEFSRGGVRLGKFEKRAAAYRERRHELEANPQAPEGVAAVDTSVADGIAEDIRAARTTPTIKKV